jgi:hypothetical protein
MTATRIAAAAALLVLGACTARETPEARVRAVIAAAEAAAEARDVGDALDLVSVEYRDARGLDRDGLRSFVRGYFALNPRIELVVKVDDVEIAGPELARARVTVGALNTGGGRLDVDAERFDLEFVREDDEWRLRRADRAGAMR